MTRIETSASCENSPKNRLLLDLVIAIGKADANHILSVLTEDASWHPVGRKPIEGREACVRAMTRYGPASRLIIEHAISHGRAGAVNGVVEFGPKRRGFCYVFEFSNAKGAQIRGVTSYSVPL